MMYGGIYDLLSIIQEPRKECTWKHVRIENRFHKITFQNLQISNKRNTTHKAVTGLPLYWEKKAVLRATIQPRPSIK